MMNLSGKKRSRFFTLEIHRSHSWLEFCRVRGDKCSNGDNYPWYLLCSPGILGDYPLNIHGKQPFAVI